MIDGAAIVSADARIGSGCSVGPFCVVGIEGRGAPVVIGVDGMLRSHTVVYRGVVAGARLRTGHGTLVRDDTSIGDDVSIGSHSVLEHHVRVGDGVRLHSGCFVPEYSILEDGCWLGPGVIVTNARFPNQPETKDHLEGVTISAGAVVGAGAVLLPGVTLGRGCLVGAGAVVVDDVDAGCTVVGNPARVVR